MSDANDRPGTGRAGKRAQRTRSDASSLRRWSSRLATVAAILAGSLPVVSASASAAEPVEIEPAMRDLWSHGSPRFQRQWLIAGPAPAAMFATVDPASIEPAAGQPVAANESPRWWQFNSWGDVGDLRPMVHVTQGAPEDLHVLAAATISRPRTGTAELSLSAEDAVTVWVNGQQVHQADAGVFALDGERIPVRLNAGQNRLLIRVRLAKQASPSSRLAVRVVESGALLPKRDEVTPSVVAEGVALTVRTHLHAEPDAPPVQVTALAAGGRVVSQVTVSRGESVRLATDAWTDGAYDLRIATRNAYGRARIVHLPWYKGDAIAAARNLLNDARNANDDETGAILRMLAELVADRAGAEIERAQSDTWMRLHSALMEYEELRLGGASTDARVHGGGFVRLAYRDPIDGSNQFCRAYLPLDYTTARRWPTIVSLHGYNSGNPRYHWWWSSTMMHSDVTDNHDAILLEPHGRGNAQYIGIGENDVLRCLDEAKRRFAVDEDRVYLTGGSMGGHGVWRIASRHPHLFAAAAAVFGGWDARIDFPGARMGPAPEAKNARQFFMYERSSSFAAAEGLLNVPLLVVHGDADKAVPVEGSRHAVRMLQRWGYEVRYHEMPGWGHEDLLERERVAEWLLQHRRDPAPTRVRLRSVDLEGAHAHWIEVGAIEEPVRLIRVDAEVIQPGVVRLDSENAAELTLALPAQLRGPRATVKVVWNGTSQELEHDAGVVELSKAAGREPALRKRPGLEGPVSNIISTPFAIVVGTTSADPLMRKYCRDRAEAFRRLWESWQHELPRIIEDTQLSRADEQRYSLILIGGADANAVTRRLAGRLPMKVARDAVTVDGRRWTAADAVLELLYPSPVAPDRYVLVVAATSPNGMYLWKPAMVQPVQGALGGWDWRLRDGRWPPASVPEPNDDAVIAAGVFDGAWRRDDRWTFEGNEQRRKSWRLRSAPAADFVPSTASLDAISGAYEIFPGFDATVAHENGQITVRVPGQPDMTLLPESEFTFAHAITGEALEFIRDANGRVTGVEFEDLNGSGRTLFVRRVAEPTAQ